VILLDEPVIVSYVPVQHGEWHMPWGILQGMNMKLLKLLQKFLHSIRRTKNKHCFPLVDTILIYTTALKAQTSILVGAECTK